tara:strand:- start:209 stop:703 length:495 start_codon:yes stop_codon:yes gene_type:complete
MAIPGHEFLYAHFSDNERTTVESYWSTPDGKETRVEYIEAKDGDPNWENLLTHIDIDTLHEATYKNIRDLDNSYKDQVMEIAKERGMVYDIDSINTDIYKAITAAIFKPFNPEEDKEKLFMFKLQLFELEQIKNNKNKTQKAKLRKSKDIIEALKAAIDIVEST